MTGRVVHFELPFDDGQRARSFYADAFGWKLQEIPEMEYTGVSTGPSGEDGMPSEPGYIGGGLFGRGDDEPRGPVVVIDVPDIEAALARVGELGGAVVTPTMPVGDMGFAAYFRDTEGNVVGLWQTAGG
jgi:predicted enzyme related to lactoylglutathione lyase